MSSLLWVVQVLLAVAFLASGVGKVLQPRQALIESGRMGWAEDFSDESVKAIGALEALAAIGLVVPPLVGVAELLTPVAASGLVVIMLGAVVVHARRGEAPMIAINVVLGGLAGFVAWSRFGPYAF